MPSKEYKHRFEPYRHLEPTEEFKMLVEVTRQILDEWGEVNQIEVNDPSLLKSVCVFHVKPVKGPSFPVNILRNGDSSRMIAPYKEIFSEVEDVIRDIEYENNTTFSPFSSLSDPD
mgnify:CR=1 FL=1